jgi:hypothetical protein
VDPSEAVIVNAKVTLYGKDRESPHPTTTGPTGEFRFTDVLPGKYHIEVEREGFTVSRSRIKIGTRSPAPLRIVLTVATLRQELTIKIPEGQLSAESSENADVMRLDRETLDSLPIEGNNVLAAVVDLLDPSVGLQPTVVVDGMVSSEIGVPASAIQEITVNDNPYSAEFSSPGQGRIQISTKTGSQQYHGSLKAEFRDFGIAHNAFAPENLPERHQVLDGSLSGPLDQSGNTTFFVSASREENHLQSIVNAITPSGAVNEAFPDTQTSTYVSAAITRKRNNGGSVSLRYSFLDRSEDGVGVGGLILPEATLDKSLERHFIYLNHKIFITPRLFNEFTARIGTSDGRIESPLPAAPAIIVGGAFTGGSAPKELQQTENGLQLNDVISWSHGNHLIKAGMNVPAFARHALDQRTNFDGTFQFASLADYEQGTPLSFVQVSGNPRLVFWYEEIGGFIQDDIRVRPSFSVSLGMRYEWQNYVSSYRNVAPRFAFAFAPGKEKKTVFRGGAGFFYLTTGPGAVADKLRLNGQLQHEIVITNPSYPDPLAGEPIGQILPSSITQFAPDLRLPYIVQYGFGIERQLQRSMFFTATYVGSTGVDLFRSRDINAPLPPFYDQRPDSAIATLRQIESAGRSESNALKVALRGQIRPYFNGMAQYVLSRSYNDTSGIDFFPANQYDLTGEWGRSDFDSLHYLSFFGELKAGKLFELGTKLKLRSGRPYTVTTGLDPYGTAFVNARPEGVARNSMDGPGFIGLDARVSRDFSLHRRKEPHEKKEGPSAMIALDAFNVLNHVNFGQPVGNIQSPFFGQPVEAFPARRLQISMALKF